MRARLVVLAAMLCVLAIQLSRASSRATAPAPVRGPEPAFGSPTAAAERPAGPAALAEPAAPLARDPFRFADEAAVATPLRESAALSTPPPLEPPPARVRFVGLVRRAGILRAALVVDGGVVLVEPGDKISGFRVLSLDEDAGVLVRDPQGVLSTLTLPEEP